MTRHRQLEALRRTSTNVENAAIDSMLNGTLRRRDFLRMGSVLGLSLPAMGVVLSACGEGSPAAPSTGETQQGGTLRVGVSAPTSPVDPVTAGNQGSIAMFVPIGEYLLQAMPDLSIEPALAESWSPNDDGTVWTFVLRSGVTFQDGRPMTAPDVVATFERLADPAGGSIALSVFQGILAAGGTSAADDLTVTFELEASVGNFPYLVSSDNYSAVILPADYNGDYEGSGFPGTGRMRMDSYDPNRGATFVRHEEYWDQENPATLDRIEFSFFADEQPALLALQGGQVDVVYQISVQNARAVLDNPAYTVINAPSAAARVMHMRTDEGPWTDKRVRQALALSIDRASIVDGLMLGRADVGNDSPFAPIFPTTDSSVPQREEDVAMARQLLADAGVGEGFNATLNVINQLEIPSYAVLIQNGAMEVGINLEVVLQDPGTYYGSSTFGSSPWLDSSAGITDYGHRSVPNVYLTAQLASAGVWNSAHIDNEQLDGLIAEYIAAVEPEAQSQAASALQTLLLDETPLIYSYFFDFLAVSTVNVVGIVPNAAGQLFLTRAALTA